MNYFDMVELFKLEKDIYDMDMTLPECEDFASFLWDTAVDHISAEERDKLGDLLHKVNKQVLRYTEYTDRLSPEEVSEDTTIDEMMDELKFRLENMACYIRFHTSAREYFKW